MEGLESTVINPTPEKFTLPLFTAHWPETRHLVPLNDKGRKKRKLFIHLEGERTVTGELCEYLSLFYYNISNSSNSSISN